MEKSKIMLAGAAVLLLLLLVIFGVYAITRLEQFTHTGRGIVEAAWEHCAQFNTSVCDNQTYQINNRTGWATNCYWNSKMDKCVAGIGYQ